MKSTRLLSYAMANSLMACLLIALPFQATSPQSQPTPAQEQPQTPPGAGKTAKPAGPENPPPDTGLSPEVRAWKVLDHGLHNESSARRAEAVRVLSLLRGEQRALTLATHGLSDNNASVRGAGAVTLGELHDASSLPVLKATLKDKDASVVIAAANALAKFKDPAAYEIFYAVLTGNMKGGKGLIASQMDQLKDPKQMALLGVEEGVGFIPFGGIGFDTYRAIHKDDGAPVRAAAATSLAFDHDAATEDALVQHAVADKSELVRVAALTALSRRDNPEVIDRISAALSDDHSAVKYTAAATILHLNDVATQKRPSAKKKPKTHSNS